MSVNCNISNNQIDETEWSRIDDVCKSHHHIGQNESIKDIIERNEERLAAHGITFDQLEKFFDKLRNHYENNEKTKISESDAELVGNIFKDVNTNGWCMWGCSKASVFNDTLTIIKITWGGAEECTFQSTEDKKYHGYEYGSHDWFFIKGDNIMHIGDLLFHQIVKHHFFQSPQSKYHVDVDKLVEFFGLTKDTDYSTAICKGRILQIEKGLTPEEFAQENIECMTHEINNVNEFYFDDKSVIMIINDKKTIPYRINGCKYVKPQYDALLLQLASLFGNNGPKKVIEKYTIVEANELSVEELSKQW